MNIASNEVLKAREAAARADAIRQDKQVRLERETFHRNQKAVEDAYMRGRATGFIWGVILTVVIGKLLGWIVV